jgi:catechol 2,3-dioxygenase-like lactoylglutathione lyase family enzyme
VAAGAVIQRTMFVLAVPDLERSGAFYRDVLGFEVRELGDPGWRLFVRDSCRIMAGRCPDAPPARDIGEHSYFGYLVVDDADAYYRRALTHKAEIVKPIATEPWGMREFGLRTVDGHRLMIGQSLEVGA